MTDIEIKLNAWEQNFVQALAVQGESEGRTIITTLIDRAGQTDGTFNAESIDRPIDLTGVTARLYCIKPDGTKTFSDGTVTDAANGKASFVLPYQATAAAGEVDCQVLLTKPDGSTLKTIGLTLNVQASSLEGAAESTSEYSALATALSRVGPAVDDAQEAIGNANSALSTANTVIGNINSKESEITSAEQGRVTAESARVSQENARKTAETTRQSQEGTRQSQESTRQTNETARGAAETTRSQNEDTRNGNEAARKTAEQDRAAAEADRQTHEADRRNVEDARVGAEQNRATAETARAAAETTRQQQETTRQTQETGRVNAETARVTAENKRQTDTQTAISGANTARDSANTAADRANTAAQNAEDAISGKLDPAIDARISAQKNQANGIAGLDGSGKVAAAQLPAMDYIPTSQRGAANGVATLGDDGKLAQDAKTLNGYGTDNGPNSVLLSGRKEGTTIGKNSTAEGGYTQASGLYSHAEGYFTTASDYVSHAEGESTTASGLYSHAEGGSTTASESFSHAEGGSTTASSPYSHAEGYFTTANVYASHAQGRYNKALTGDPSAYSATADAMVIGNGTKSSALSNCFRVTFSGNVYGLSSYHSSGADYSEFFEWLDENPNKEDRVGHFVTLDGEKIRYANDGDYIVGIISGNPVIIGDHPSESWCGRYLRDVFGRMQYEDVVIPETQEKDKDGNVIRTIPEHTETHFKVNPDYDPEKESEYENREKRPEWATVGMLGKLVCIDDGTCEVNGYCKPANGIATKADTGYRVLARLDATHIKVLIK